MRRRIRVNRLLLWFSLFTFVAPGFTDQARTPQVNEEVHDFKIFTDRVQEYARMQKDLKASLPDYLAHGADR